MLEWVSMLCTTTTQFACMYSNVSLGVSNLKVWMTIIIDIGKNIREYGILQGQESLCGHCKHAVQVHLSTTQVRVNPW